MKCDVDAQKEIPPVKDGQLAAFLLDFPAMLSEELPKPRDQIELLEWIVGLRCEHFVKFFVTTKMLFHSILWTTSETNRHDDPQRPQGTPSCLQFRSIRDDSNDRFSCRRIVRCDTYLIHVVRQAVFS